MKIHPGFRKLFNIIVKFKKQLIYSSNIIYLNAQTHDLSLQYRVLTN